ncbi:hypothetical protein K435DRAFT_847634 [Dendrothele bispora CBS 962.96]|uniref:Uncharacterized protein n=1 Tax=Dendrothele bispora (strain CBS 962.96) TaxID=1314807 RepID=A0A4S8MX90_DENBC|nr:hypothetical protein K435DRAFT_847634 [Dendrothele bispora CBS 962.96]
MSNLHSPPFLPSPVPPFPFAYAPPLPPFMSGAPLPPFPAHQSVASALCPALGNACLRCAIRNTPCLFNDSSSICLGCQQSRCDCHWDPQIQHALDAEYCIAYSLRCLLASRQFYQNSQCQRELLRLFEIATSLLRSLVQAVNQPAAPHPLSVVAHPLQAPIKRPIPIIPPESSPSTRTTTVPVPPEMPSEDKAPSVWDKAVLQRPASIPPGYKLPQPDKEVSTHLPFPLNITDARVPGFSGRYRRRRRKRKSA